MSDQEGAILNGTGHVLHGIARPAVEAEALAVRPELLFKPLSRGSLVGKLLEQLA